MNDNKLIAWLTDWMADYLTDYNIHAAIMSVYSVLDVDFSS